MNQRTSESFRLPARGLTNADVLRAFDSLRRQVAQRMCGSAGAFVGYTKLELSLPAGMDCGWITFVAHLVEATATWHRVSYEALHTVERDMAAAVHQGSSVIATGEGVTAQPNGQRTQRDPNNDELSLVLAM